MKSWFPMTGVTGQDIADLARANVHRMPNWANQNFFGQHAVRDVYDVNNPFNCYNACIFWAFQAGAISKRFLFNKLGIRDGNTFYPTFSTCGWKTLVEYQVTKGIPENDQSKWKVKKILDVSNGGEFDIPAGITVYFDQEPNKVFGHVAFSLGDGTVISQNSVIPSIWGEIGPSKWPSSPLRRPKWDAEVDKMTRAETPHPADPLPTGPPLLPDQRVPEAAYHERALLGGVLAGGAMTNGWPVAPAVERRLLVVAQPRRHQPQP
jgi:hypothetical protein